MNNGVCSFEIHDLECYVDNDLKFECGRIVGRNTGIKGWFRDNIPVLESKYSTIMRYKAMAKKLRQLVELDDPIPAEAVLANEEYLQNFCADENINECTDNYTNENTDKHTNDCTVESSNTSTNSLQNTNSNSIDNKNAITMRNIFKWWKK